MSKGTKVRYSKEELTWIKQHRHWPRQKAHLKFCAKFGRGDVSLHHYTSLCKRKGWTTGRTGRFEKGSVPYNTGKKMPFNANSARTQFKKGQLPPNTKHLGHERISRDGYIEISIDETNPHTGYERRYVLKHKYLWELKNGKIPKDMCLKCLDGNRQNTDPENWEAIPRSALPFLNGHRGHNYDEANEELRPAILTLAKLKYRKGEITKSKNEILSTRIYE
jgi:hypothetical protein